MESDKCDNFAKLKAKITEIALGRRDKKDDDGAKKPNRKKDQDAMEVDAFGKGNRAKTKAKYRSASTAKERTEKAKRAKAKVSHVQNNETSRLRLLVQ